MEFQFPWILLLLTVLPGLVFIRKSSRSAMPFSQLELTWVEKPSWRIRFRGPLLKSLRVMSLILFCLALARPRLPETEVWQETEGIDILMVVDASSSMLAEDFKLGMKPASRFNAVKKVTADFITGREQDRIGMVFFAGEAMTVCPLTTDYGVLLDTLDQISLEANQINRLQNQERTPLMLQHTPLNLPDGTAIGTALAFSTNRLKNAKGDSRIMILLTDGASNAGEVDPVLGAELAASQKIKVYTIGAGSNGPVPIPTWDPVFGKRYQYAQFPLDEGTLQRIAHETSGKYFRATHTKALAEIYDEINKMETTEVETSRHTEYHEIFAWFLISGMFFLAFEILLRQTLLLRLP